MTESVADATKVTWQPTMSRPREDEGADPRQELLEAAAETFMEQGYSGASIDDIADRLGATKGRVYHYYRSKLDILLDIHIGILEHMTSGIVPIAEDHAPAADRLERMVHRHALTVIHNMAASQVTLHSVLDSFSNRKQMEVIVRISQLRRDYEAIFIRVLEDGQREGEFSFEDSRLAGKAVLGVLNWLTIWYRVDEAGRDEPESVARSLSQFILRGVGHQVG